MMHVSNIQHVSCPTCRTVFRLATALHANIPIQPRPGAFAVCAHCGEIVQFDAALTLHVAAPEAVRSPDTRALLLHAQQMIRHSCGWSDAGVSRVH